jgi:hypothetical protein
MVFVAVAFSKDRAQDPLVESGDQSLKSPRSLTRASLALGVLAPFVMSGCASIPRADADKHDNAAIAE